ncbi:phosphatidylglycerophosphatase A family protein [Wenzhouxiangella marina]|uniref:Phosphatidylglycerophosphatase A n=1 Tax=Wenzhouxiangella marina TaxID=1579979 RepID=A0A0K0XY49_9GAMM|nr:phosphatidylglycerophosphatase A [Wenzhouxiangella marina]AKS42595.1 Phosphatidylglycerophosphatase [Wenzhouxiangella marina]MBB6085623.1 phosphatidylglycerophosphatase A [Wenzhouxiangella marina]
MKDGITSAAERSHQVALATPSGFLAFGLGSGLSPIAPGTAGTLAAMLPALFLVQLPVWVGLLIVALSFVLGIWICERAGQALGVHDFGGIVWDEFVGFWLVLVLVPADWRWWLAAFLAFRLFDILKPWPIRWLDRQVHGGLGVMVDDLLAGIYALLLLWLLARLV